MENNIKIFGKEIIDTLAIDQLKSCTGEEDYGVLTADAHVGYAHPIGGAIAYKDKISLSGVGFDIACGDNQHTQCTAYGFNAPYWQVLLWLYRDYEDFQKACLAGG